MHVTFDSLKTFYNILVQKLKNHRGNWEQNDPTADDYIKNRPFYSSVQEIEILPETTVTVFDAYSVIEEPFSITLTKGETYNVIFNGVPYTCVTKEIYDDEPFIGNSSILEWNDNKDTGEPFFIDVWMGEDVPYVYFATDTPGEHTISISTARETVHQIDKKYVPLPDGIITEDDVYNIMDDNLSSVAFSGDYNDLSNQPTTYSDVIRYDVVQELTDEQKQTARNNIDAAATSDLATKITVPERAYFGDILSVSNYEADNTPIWGTTSLFDDLYESNFTPVENGGSFRYNGKTFNYVGQIVSFDINTPIKIKEKVGPGGTMLSSYFLSQHVSSYSTSDFGVVYFYRVYNFRDNSNNMSIEVNTQIGLTEDGKVFYYTNYAPYSGIIDILTYTGSVIAEKYLPNTVVTTDDIEALQTLVGETPVSEQISDAVSQKSQVQIITWEADD